MTHDEKSIFVEKLRDCGADVKPITRPLGYWPVMLVGLGGRNMVVFFSNDISPDDFIWIKSWHGKCIAVASPEDFKLVTGK